MPQRQAVGTFDVCLARLKDCPADIVCLNAAQLIIDTTVDQFCENKYKYSLLCIGPKFNRGGGDEGPELFKHHFPRLEKIMNTL